MGLTLDGIALVTGVSLSSAIFTALHTDQRKQAGSGVGEATALGFAEAGALGVVFADAVESDAQASVERSKKLAKTPITGPLRCKSMSATKLAFRLW